MIRPKNIIGFLAVAVSPALIQGCDARSPVESAPGGPLAASAPGTFPPPAPVGVTSTLRADSFAILVGWTHDGSQLASGWRVDRREVALDSAWTQIAADSGAGGRFLDASFPVGAARTLEYRVRVCNAAGCGTSLATSIGVPALPAPGRLTAVADSGRVTVTWEPLQPGSWIYQVMRRTASTAFAPRVTTAPGTTSFVDTPVSPGQTYYYQVRALLPAGPPATGRYRPSPWSQEASATPGGTGAGGAPVARADSSRTAGTTGATLYGAATPNGQPTAVRFQWGTTPSLIGASTTPLDSIGAGFAPVAVSATLSGLSAGTTYYYRLIASNAAGADSSAVLPLRLGPPAAPRIQAAFVRPAYAVDLSWSASGAQTYRVERRAPLDSAWTTLLNGSTQTSLQDRTVPLDSLYRFEYRVTACNGLGCTPSQVLVSTVPLPVPSAFGAQVAQNEVRLAWGTNGAPSTAFYQVLRRTPGTPFQPRVTTGPGGTAFTDASVMADSTYLYQVRALLPTAGQPNRRSAWSGVLTVKVGVGGLTPGVTTGPPSFVGTQVVLTGTVDVRAPGTTAFFEYSENPALVPFTTVGVIIPAGASGPTPVSLSMHRTTRPLYYRLGARDGAGTVRGGIQSAAYAPVLSAATDLRGWFDGSRHVVQLRWTPDPAAESYRVTRVEPGQPPRSYTAAPGQYQDVDIRLDSARIATYVVRPCTSLGCGPVSDSVRVTVVPLAAPGGAEAEAIDIDRAVVQWDDLSTGESGFIVERWDPAQGRFRMVAKVRVNGATSHTDTGLTPGATYQYRVRAYRDENTRMSLPSNVAEVTLPSSASSTGATGG
jgi:hypothetical protein